MSYHGFMAEVKITECEIAVGKQNGIWDQTNIEMNGVIIEHHDFGIKGLLDRRNLKTYVFIKMFLTDDPVASHLEPYYLTDSDPVKLSGECIGDLVTVKKKSVDDDFDVRVDITLILKHKHFDRIMSMQGKSLKFDPVFYEEDGDIKQGDIDMGLGEVTTYIREAHFFPDLYEDELESPQD